MFIPNSRIISRLADCRIDGRVDERFENELGKENNKFDYYDDVYNQRERMQEVVSDIMETDTSLTSVDKYGSQAEYDRAMAENLGTDNYSMSNKERYTRSHYITKPTVYNGSGEVSNLSNRKVRRNNNLGYYIDEMSRRQEHDKQQLNNNIQQQRKPQYEDIEDNYQYEENIKPILVKKQPIKQQRKPQYENIDNDQYSKHIIKPSYKQRPIKQQYEDIDENIDEISEYEDMDNEQYNDQYRESFAPIKRFKNMFNKSYICINKNTLVIAVVVIIIALLLVYSYCVNKKLNKLQNQQSDISNKMNNMKIIPLSNILGGNGVQQNNNNNINQNNNNDNNNINNGIMYLRSPDPPLKPLNNSNNIYNDII